MPRYAIVPIPELLSRYQAGTDGSVWSLWHKGRWGGWRDEPYLLALTEDKNGYQQVGITVRNRAYVFYVHHLVLITFRGEKPPYMEARHKDGVRNNNALSNLCWGTRMANNNDKRRHGTMLSGSKCSWATIDEDTAAAIKYDLRLGMSPAEIASSRGVKNTIVYNIKDGKAWKRVKAKDHAGSETRGLRKTAGVFEA